MNQNPPTMDNVCDDQVYSELFRSHSRTVFNYIYYKFGNEEKAHDAVQEAFVKLWENCAKVAPEKAKAFVYTVANNLYLNVLKAEKVRLKYRDPKAPVTIQNPQYLMEEQEFREKLEAALAATPLGPRRIRGH